jgi:hypothetical protein
MEHSLGQNKIYLPWGKLSADSDGVQAGYGLVSSRYRRIKNELFKRLNLF